MLRETGDLPDFFFHMYEEPDLVLRAWDRGYRVLQWNEIVVYHAFTPQGRNEQRNHRRHARNEACSTVMRYPFLLVLPVLLGKLVSQFRYACRRGLSWVVREPLIWWDVFRRLPLALRHRAPVKSTAVKTVMALNRRRITDPLEAKALGARSWFEVFRS
jgi:GT2 family glycosyltransferase